MRTSVSLSLSVLPSRFRLNRHEVQYAFPVLCGCESWSFVLRADYGLAVCKFLNSLYETEARIHRPEDGDFIIHGNVGIASTYDLAKPPKAKVTYFTGRENAKTRMN